MNTSLFVGLCEDAGLNVEFGEMIISVYGPKNEEVAGISETTPGLYRVNAWGASNKDALKIVEYVTEYALTPIEERE